MKKKITSERRKSYAKGKKSRRKLWAEGSGALESKDKQRRSEFVESKDKQQWNEFVASKDKQHRSKLVVHNKAKACQQQRARHNRICHFSRRFGGYSHYCNNSISSQNTRALGCNLEWNYKLVGMVFCKVRTYLSGVGKRVQETLSTGARTQGALSVGKKRQRILSTGKRVQETSSIGESGQGTVEYALVMAAIMSIVVALGALAKLLGDGTFVEHALACASHHVQAATPGAVADVFIY